MSDMKIFSIEIDLDTNTALNKFGPLARKRVVEMILQDFIRKDGATQLDIIRGELKIDEI